MVADDILALSRMHNRQTVLSIIHCTEQYKDKLPRNTSH